VENLRYMHRNPVKNGLVQQPDRSYGYTEEGKVKINQWPAAELKFRPTA